MKLASILYEPKGYETERKLWNKIWLTITEQTTYACMTAKSGKSACTKCSLIVMLQLHAQIPDKKRNVLQKVCIFINILSDIQK